MIKLTEIKKLRGHRYLVKLLKNDVEHVHIVHEETILHYNLLGPKTLTEQDYKRIIKSSEEDILYNKALYFIEFKMRTISEVKKQLRRTTQNETLIDQMIVKLKKQGYLDDNKYTKEYITEKIEFDLIGPRYVKEKLIGKGIHFDLIDTHLLLYKEEYQYDKIRELLKKETKYTIKKPYIKAYQSIKGKLINKGFNPGIVESSMISCKEMIEDAVDEQGLLDVEFKKLKKGVNLKDFKEKDKLVKKLLTKGFRYDLVKEMLQ